jgi:hypothetical protein
MKCVFHIYEEMLRGDFFIYVLGDLEFSKMTWRDVGPQALVSRNISY